jgi:hypothetical protein
LPGWAPRLRRGEEGSGEVIGQVLSGRDKEKRATKREQQAKRKKPVIKKIRQGLDLAVSWSIIEHMCYYVKLNKGKIYPMPYPKTNLP